MATDQQRIEIQVKLADALAEHALMDKVDKHGKPLIEHSRRVAAAVKHLSHEQHIAALLHDVVEETANDPQPVSFSLIDNIFGLTVGNMVGLLTPNPNLTYQQEIEVIALYPKVRPLKLADLNDNLDVTRGPIEFSLKQRYERAKQLLIDVELEEKERGQAASRAGQSEPAPSTKGNGK